MNHDKTARTTVKANKKSGGYDPSSIESKWQSKWEDEKLYQIDLKNAKKPFYNLMMFPYPSAEGLHVGSFFTYGGIDAYGRFKRLQGYDVFEPIGLDGFGIHSENYALKVGRTPPEHAKISEENFYRQLHTLGNMFDWSRTVETYDPNYYQWTQWVFIALFKAGLAYKAKAKVNFCPSCKTVLADEQVIDGKCERCNTIVEKRDLEQWFFRITDYAERLLANLATLDWSEKVKTAQKNWIGKSEGALITFPVLGNKIYIDVFTTRPDTLFGATFMVVSPEHPMVSEFTTDEKRSIVETYRKKAKEKTEDERKENKEKSGVFTGAYVINPINNQHLSIWIADYVLMGYGTGAIMAVPAHDERDFAFAQKYNLPILPVIKPDKESTIQGGVYTGQGTVQNSGDWDGLRIPEEKGKILSDIEKRGIGKKEITYHLRDWLISRQRYWGAPIPMIFCQQCFSEGKSWFTNQEKEEVAWDARGWYPEEQLPVLLPSIDDYKPQGEGKSPLANYPEFYKATCPSCGSEAVRETDVADTFLDSSWYFFRYTSTEYDDRSFDKEIVKKWLPIHSYIGGAEHSVLHLLYSRFITMVFHDLRYISFDEPFARFRHNGLIIKDGAKMSKSKGNVINPDEYVKKFGADTLRAYLAFIGPFSDGGDFRETGIEGMYRFLMRVWKLLTKREAVNTKPSDTANRIMHQTIAGITEDMEGLRFNTAIAKLMTWYNHLSREEAITEEEKKTFLLLLAPFTPHLTEEIWEKLGHTTSIHNETYPSVDHQFLVTTQVTIAIQMNGKLRGTITGTPTEAADAKLIEEKARAFIATKQDLANRQIKKVIYIQGKVINFVV